MTASSNSSTTSNNPNNPANAPEGVLQAFSQFMYPNWQRQLDTNHSIGEDLVRKSLDLPKDDMNVNIDRSVRGISGLAALGMMAGTAVATGGTSLLLPLALGLFNQATNPQKEPTPVQPSVVQAPTNPGQHTSTADPGQTPNGNALSGQQKTAPVASPVVTKETHTIENNKEIIFWRKKPDGTYERVDGPTYQHPPKFERKE
jgi:hypothetical protein